MSHFLGLQNVLRVQCPLKRFIENKLKVSSNLLGSHRYSRAVRGYLQFLNQMCLIEFSLMAL